MLDGLPDDLGVSTPLPARAEHSKSAQTGPECFSSKAAVQTEGCIYHEWWDRKEAICHEQGGEWAPSESALEVAAI